MTSHQWNSLLHLKPSDFKKPDGLHLSIVTALDQFIGHIGSRPIILSDHRPGDTRTHGEGRAIDTAWPGVDSELLYAEALKFPLFKGIGIYINEQGATSFHFDTRTATQRDYGPDRWGGVISHPLDSRTGENVRQTAYVAAETVLSMVKKNAVSLIIFLALSGLLIYHYTRR